MKVQVIEKKKGRIDRTTGEIIKGNLRVCAYARVSTEKGNKNKFKTIFKDNEIMPNFDKDVFELMIEKVIIGEKDSKGKVNPRVITFILKSGNEIKCEEERNSVTEKILETQNNKNQQSSYEASENYLQQVSEPY